MSYIHTPKVFYIKKGEVVFKDSSFGEKGGIIHYGNKFSYVIYINAITDEKVKAIFKDGIQIKNYSTSTSSTGIYLKASGLGASLIIDNVDIYCEKGVGLYAFANNTTSDFGSFIINNCKIDAGENSIKFGTDWKKDNSFIYGGEFNTRSSSPYTYSLSGVNSIIKGGTFNKWNKYAIKDLSNEVGQLIIDGTKMTIVDEAPAQYVARVKINEINCYTIDNDINYLITTTSSDIHIEVKKNAIINANFGSTKVDIFPELEFKIESEATLTGTITTESAIVKHSGAGNFNVTITPSSEDFEIAVDGNQAKSAYKEEKIVAIGTRRETGEEVRMTLGSFNSNLTNYYTQVKLLRNIDLSNVLEIKKDFILDLNGNTITGSTINVTKNNYSIIKLSYNGVTLTINDSSEEQTGAIISNNSELYCIHLGTGNKTQTITVIINGGKFITSSCTTINVQYGTVVINGGYFEATAENGDTFNINCIDENYKAGTASISVKGGTFKNFNPGNNNAEGEKTSFVTEGHKVEESTDGDNTIYTVVIE